MRTFFRVMARVWFLLSIALVFGIAQAKEPSTLPSTGGQNATAPASQVQEPAAQNLIGSDKNPLVIKAVVPVKTIEQVEQDRREREEKAANDRGLLSWTKVLGWATIALAVVALGQLGMFWFQLRVMTGATKAAGVAADAAKTSAGAVMLAERAYVKMSHVPPGVQWFERNKQMIRVEVEVKNHGRTPASVTDVKIGAKLLENGELLQEPFSYPTRESVPNAFLVTNEAFFHDVHFQFRGQDLDATKSGAKKLWIFGHVDYIDTFDTRHRSGYVRVYVPAVEDGKQNNLFYMTEAKYNYDRPRKPGEGNDWN